MFDSRGTDEAGPTIIWLISYSAFLFVLAPSGISSQAITGGALFFGGGSRWLSAFVRDNIGYLRSGSLVVHVPPASTLPSEFAS